MSAAGLKPQPPAESAGPLTVTTSAASPFALHSESDSASTSGQSSCASSRADDFGPPPARPLACADCPHRAESAEKLQQHRAGHEQPRGPFAYKCVFCGWFAKKKTAVERHMALHTASPQQFMPQVSREPGHLVQRLDVGGVTQG